MSDPIERARQRALPRLRRIILRGRPRLAVSAMLALTTLAGFLCSAALLRLGLRGMGPRYALSVLVAYGVLLLLLRAWVVRARRAAGAGASRLRGGRGSATGDAVGDVLDAVGDSVGGTARGAGRWVGEGGRFAGGGASGSFDLPAQAVVASTSGDGGGVGSAALDVASGALDVDLGDDGWPVVAVIAVVLLLLSGVAAAAYLVYSAPTLLSEVCFDGAVAGVLYRRLRRGSPREWWEGALSRTWIPALVVLVFFTAGGFLLERAAPGARTLGEVLRWLADRPPVG